jgi:site-specific DNA-methyltransferase (adenine-specific)
MTLYYAADGITLYLGDCREITEWLAADVLVTDPPYGIAWTKGLNKAAGSRRHDGIANDRDTSVRDAALTMAAHMPAVVFGSLAAPFPERVKQTLVWQKPNDAGVVGSVTGFRRDIEAVFLVGDWPQRTVQWSSVLRSRASMVGGANSPAGRTGHPHAKPVDLMEQIVAACPPGTVADPFAGSGATLLAARAQGRRAIGVELHEPYCEVIAKRLAQGDLFGETA